MNVVFLLLQVHKKVESCGHTVKVKCCETPTRAQCKGKCTLNLPCGHACDKKCNENCTTKCTHFVDNPHAAACRHKFQIPCYKVSEGMYNVNIRLLHTYIHICLKIK